MLAMFLDTREKLTTKGAASYLNVAEVTIHKYVKDGLLEPVFKNWKNDGTKLFFLEDVQKLEGKLKRPGGMTISEIAKRLGISNSHILKHIKSGKLVAKKHIYKGKETYFIESEIAEEFIKNIQITSRNKKQYSIQIDGTEYFLYQKLSHSYDDSKAARIIDVQYGKVITNQEEVISLQEAIEQGYEMTSTIRKGKYISTKGSVRFEFMKPRMNDSMLFVIIDWFYTHITPSNMNINIVDNVVIVSVKPSTLLVDTMYFQEEIQYLNKHLIEGSLSIREDKVILRSDWDSIKFYLREHEKEKLQQLAKEQSISLEQLCENLIRKSLNNI